VLLITNLLSLRRRFEQNQEDCTFTVLALLPTATENILDSLQVESITHELQQHRAARLARGAEASEVAPSDVSSVAPGTMDDEKKSVQSFASESYVDAGQAETSTSSTPVEGSQPEQEQRQRPRKSKLQLWNELKINCEESFNSLV
jgi:peroxin-3